MTTHHLFFRSPAPTELSRPHLPSRLPPLCSAELLPESTFPHSVCITRRRPALPAIVHQRLSGWSGSYCKLDETLEGTVPGGSHACVTSLEHLHSPAFPTALQRPHAHRQAMPRSGGALLGVPVPTDASPKAMRAFSLRAVPRGMALPPDPTPQPPQDTRVHFPKLGFLCYKSHQGQGGS